MMFGGIPIISQPYPYVIDKTNRKFVADPFMLMSSNEKILAGLKSEPYIAVVYSSFDRRDMQKKTVGGKQMQDRPRLELSLLVYTIIFRCIDVDINIR